MNELPRLIRNQGQSFINRVILKTDQLKFWKTACVCMILSSKILNMIENQDLAFNGNTYFLIYIFKEQIPQAYKFSLHYNFKNQISKSGICHCQQQKCYRNPFFCHFKPEKDYDRHPHRFIAKVNFLGLNWTKKKC